MLHSRASCVLWIFGPALAALGCTQTAEVPSTLAGEYDRDGGRLQLAGHELHMQPLPGHVEAMVGLRWKNVPVSDTFVSIVCSGERCTFRTKANCVGELTSTPASSTSAASIAVTVNEPCGALNGTWKLR